MPSCVLKCTVKKKKKENGNEVGEQHMCDNLCEIVWQRSKVNLIWNKCAAPAMARPCRPENRQYFLDVESTQGQVI